MRNRTRSGLAFVFFLFYATACWLIPAVSGLVRYNRGPVEARWHGPAHRWPQEVYRGWKP